MDESLRQAIMQARRARGTNDTTNEWSFKVDSTSNTSIMPQLNVPSIADQGASEGEQEHDHEDDDRPPPLVPESGDEEGGDDEEDIASLDGDDLDESDIRWMKSNRGQSIL